MDRLNGQRAVVTGGGRGIGAAIARRLGAEGAHVTVLDLDLEPAREVAGEIGGVAVRCDVADPAAVHATLGGDRSFQILVNNAGYDSFAWFTDVTPEQWRRMLAVNLEGVFACTQAVLPAMQRAKYGRIITVSSEAGRIGSKGNAVYAATKAAGIGFMKSIARENGRFAITANALVAGPTDTPLLDKVRAQGEIGERQIAAMIAGTQLARLAAPEELAAAAAFLASPEAGYITGEAFGVSGGMGLGA